ncbi:hypothetical protein EDB81DRAFT_914984 [Dactylonectria macrodidyma]|uniref:NWD NACHT-NTPase N-terminal domain-containing protein n=1 Tax=Dactylonectria macrodidyma TaxID=307937 RepID=A0A9P9IG00_9HYPO|nr:hypothetical protein EDB81DRAFT_914984 [Dactylonectria macrodidyma]
MTPRLFCRWRNVFRHHDKTDPEKSKQTDGPVHSSTDSSGPGNASRSPQALKKVENLPPEPAASSAVEPASPVSNLGPSTAVPSPTVSTRQPASLKSHTSARPPEQSETAARSLSDRGYDGLGDKDAQPTPSPPGSSGHETSSQSLQERLWNQAYDELKVNERTIVEAYEKILSGELHRCDSTSTGFESRENEIEQTRETRWCQMKLLVQAGLERTRREAAIKQGIEDGLQAISAVRGIVDKAVQAAPEAAIAWVGVCLGLEVGSAVPTPDLRSLPANNV